MWTELEKPDPFGWISLLAIAIALHGYHHGFRPIFPAMSSPWP